MPAPPCVLVLFGASGDLTKRLLAPSLYHLAADGLLPERFAVLGLARDRFDDAVFQQRIGDAVRTFSPRKETIDASTLTALCRKFHYLAGAFDDPTTYARLAESVAALDRAVGAEGNVLFYLATPPSLFGRVSHGLREAGLNEGTGWRRVIIEKPFGHDLASAVALGEEILGYWREEQVWRIDHYLGKETVQNLLAFRFANGIFEPLWNRHHIDHIQFTAAEAVGVEGRGGYYEGTGVVRDMVQNHMFQMLAYLCMEPPTTFAADDVRDEKARLLRAIRVLKAEEVASAAVRGQYGPGREGSAAVPGYRQEPSVAPDSATETFCAVRVDIDNWRWQGVPIYLRSGKRMWRKGTEIVVQFRRPPVAMVPGDETVEANRLVFHIQPEQGIELRVQAKVPGASLRLREVSLRFAWGDAFHAARATGYEVLLHHAMIGDATLFSRTDLVEAAWRVVQPILDAWAAAPPDEFPNYAAGTWGPAAAYDLLERDGRRWMEVANRELLATVPLFSGADPALLASVALAMRPTVVEAGETVIRRGATGDSMYVLCRGTVDVLGEGDAVVATFHDGEVFGEIALLFPVRRTATVRARTTCDLMVLPRSEFEELLRGDPEVVGALRETARRRYPEAGEGG